MAKDRSVRRWHVLLAAFSKVFGDQKIVGAEVGVWKADTSVRLLNGASNLTKLYCIDPYRSFSEQVYRCRRSKTWDPEKWEALYQSVRRKLQRFGGRVELIRNTSKKGAIQVPNDLDFVFIDGNHAYEYVLQDIGIWEPKVRPGGIVSGHDYGSKFHWGVQKAVDEYAKAHGREVRTGKDGVWWWVK
jgi:hypothetical protein